MIALYGGRVIAQPGTGASEATVLIENDTILEVTRSPQIPAQAEAIDCSGCTILAGFWNSHVHFFERKWAAAAALPRNELRAQLEDFTRFGFTTVFDLSSELENTRDIRNRIESREVHRPRIFTTRVSTP